MTEHSDWQPWSDETDPVAGMLIRMSDGSLCLIGHANQSGLVCDGCSCRFDRELDPVEYCIVWTTTQEVIATAVSP